MQQNTQSRKLNIILSTYQWWWEEEVIELSKDDEYIWPQIQGAPYFHGEVHR